MRLVGQVVEEWRPAALLAERVEAAEGVLPAGGDPAPELCRRRGGRVRDGVVRIALPFDLLDPCALVEEHAVALVLVEAALLGAVGARNARLGDRHRDRAGQVGVHRHADRALDAEPFLARGLDDVDELLEPLAVVEAAVFVARHDLLRPAVVHAERVHPVGAAVREALCADRVVVAVEEVGRPRLAQPEGQDLELERDRARLLAFRGEAQRARVASRRGVLRDMHRHPELLGLPGCDRGARARVEHAGMELLPFDAHPAWPWLHVARDAHVDRTRRDRRAVLASERRRGERGVLERDAREHTDARGLVFPGRGDERDRRRELLGARPILLPDRLERVACEQMHVTRGQWSASRAASCAKGRQHESGEQGAKAREGAAHRISS